MGRSSTEDFARGTVKELAWRDDGHGTGRVFDGKSVPGDRQIRRAGKLKACISRTKAIEGNGNGCDFGRC